MKRYILDTHVHTSETSSCGKIEAKELVRLYKGADYHGLVITDHYYKGYFDSLGPISWKEKTESFLTGYKNAYSEGRKLGVKIILGMEIRFEENANDYLVFGVTEEILQNRPMLYTLGLKDFKSLAQNSGMLVYQAHPYRKGMVVADPADLDGVETYNGNPRHDSHNEDAIQFAEQNRLKKSSGSDFHQRMDLARGGIIIPELPSDSQELVRLLNENETLELLSSGD